MCETTKTAQVVDGLPPQGDGVWVHTSDRQEALRMLKSIDMCGVLWDLQMILRDKLKHGHTYETADAALEDVQQQLYSIMDDHGINLDELYS